MTINLIYKLNQNVRNRNKVESNLSLFEVLDLSYLSHKFFFLKNKKYELDLRFIF